jgi:hypothetical protein
MKILATDLDRTLLPNGSWPADPDAIRLFNTLTEANDLTVVYVTGRNLALSEQAIRDYGIRHPHILIGDVGTSIRHYSDDGWAPHRAWDAHVQRLSPRWDPEAVHAALAGIDGLRRQEAEHCGPFKQSYYVAHDRRAALLARVDQQVKGRFDEVIVYSHDSQTGSGLLDLLPAAATKQTALEFVADELGIAKGEVVFCGDSGNDIFPLTAGFSGVLVRNADEQLVAQVRQAMAERSGIRAYFASGGFRGMNGYYTSGVIEGAYHYGLFADD